MLQGPALEAWADARASLFRQRIAFTGVFIPTDRTWTEQLEALGGAALEPHFRRIFIDAAFTTNVLRQLLAALHYRVAPSTEPSLVPHRRVSLSRDHEAVLVRELARAWHLDPILPSLSALRRSLTARLTDIGALARAEGLRDPAGRAERLANTAFLHFPFLASAALAVDTFQDVGTLQREKWALLFDELELAPQWIRTSLVSYLRSVDDRFIFKLAMSPYSEEAPLLDTPVAPAPGHDFDSISLWYAHKEDGYRFCRSLFRSMLRDNGLPDVDPTQLLGRSEFETDRSEWTATGSAYRPGSRLHNRFYRLAAKDRSFMQYLDSRGIDLRQLHELSGDARAAEIRKITSLVAVRETFRRTDQSASRTATRLRSRKNPPLYRGAAALFAIVEGNPRWFIGIIGTLLRNSLTGQRSLDAEQQNSEVDKAANRFRALLKTIPSPSLTADQQPRGVLSLLDPIGEYFYKAVVRDDFNPDPPGTFIVDSTMPQAMCNSLGRALNAGAIVYVPDPESALVLGSPRGKRFRLCYLLAASYHIPLRLGRPVSLVSILRSMITSRPGPQPPLPELGDSNA